MPEKLTKWQARTRETNKVQAELLPTTTLLTARHALGLPVPTVLPTKRAACAPLADIIDLSTVKAGPRQLLDLLHSLGVHVVKTKGYACTPHQVTYHHSQELLALALNVTTKTVQRWTRELEALGHVATRAHFGGDRHAARVDGLVIAVALKPGHHARLHHEDLAHQWRDLDRDRAAGRTAWAAARYLSESKASKKTEMDSVLRNWAVRSSFTRPPFFTDADTGPTTVSEVAYTLPLLASMSHRNRCGLVTSCAAALAKGLNDDHSQAWYASIIWQAVDAEDHGISALQPLTALLMRLQADCAEWSTLRRPGALLAARMRKAS